MSRRLTRLLLLPLLFVAGQALALGLGDIRLQSALNEPLRAEIDLLAAAPEELNNLTVQLASAETFERYGLDRPFFLVGMAFEVVASGTTSGNIIRIRTPGSVTEPFITFLVEAVWSRGRLLREYTLLLDPPTFASPPVTQSTQTVTAPSRSTQSDAGRIERPASATRPTTPPPASRPPPRVQAPVQSAPVTDEPTPLPPETTPYEEPAAPTEAVAPYSSLPPETFVTLPSGELLVQRGDTLWGIAWQYRPDSSVTMSQMMMALFEANPEAFANNINILSAGAKLRIPTADDIYRISRGDAQSAVQQQHAEWSGEAIPTTPALRTEPSLTLVPPDDDQTGYDAEPTASGDDFSREYEIEDRIIELEANVPDQAALLEIHNNELAQLRAELARMRGEEPPVELPVDDELLVDDADAMDDSLADDADIFLDDATADIDGDETAVDDEVADDTSDDTTATPVVDRPAQKPSLLDTILGYVLSVWGAIAGAVIVVIGILIWFARRAGRDDDEDPTGLWETLDPGDVESESLASTERLRAIARDEDSSIVVVEQESKAAMAAEMASDRSHDTTTALDPAAAPAVDMLVDTGTDQSLEDTFSSETAINLDQSDPIAEADFHMAYGLHDQAADLINGALEAEPQREDLRAKLCEVYFVWGNRDAFIDAAQGMKNVVGDVSSAEWDKIIIMGQQIAADHELFSGKSAGEATKAVDLAFDDASEQAGELDMDLAGGPDGEVSDVIDLGAESGEVAAASDSSAIDFAFDEEEVDTSASATSDLLPESDSMDDVFESPAIDTSADEETADTPAVSVEADVDEGKTSETPTIEQQFENFDATGQVAALVDDDATQLASLDDEFASTDATAEINLDDLGLDLDALADSNVTGDIASDAETMESILDDTSKVEVLSMGDLEATGKNLEVDIDDDALQVTGQHVAIDEDEFDPSDATGLQSTLTALDEADTADVTGRNPVLPDLDDLSIPGDDPESEKSLLDATGQTQVLSDDFAVDTFGGDEPAIADDEQTMMAQSLGGEIPLQALPEEAETLLAPLDDDDDDDFTKTEALDDDDVSDFDFARTEALPKDVFLGEPSTDETGELPALTGSTDMDLDLDDLTAALKVSEVGDTINQRRNDATVEQPRLHVDDRSDESLDLNIGLDDDDDDDVPTQALSPDQVSADLHDARTMTEVGTKLDLARAYVDMGDPSGARSILEEVLDEGDAGQKQQAQQLLDSLPS
jgi:pilus assembly protein FimV